jgi:hypothetical protein
MVRPSPRDPESALHEEHTATLLTTLTRFATSLG